MATVRASCIDCGDIELTNEDIVVRVCLDDDRAECRFTCPACKMTTVKATDSRTVDLLISAGALMDTWVLPAELYEPCRTSEAKGIDHDDLIDFNKLLQDEQALAEAIAALSTT